MSAMWKTDLRQIYAHVRNVDRYVHFKRCQASLPTYSHACFTLAWLLGNTPPTISSGTAPFVVFGYESARSLKSYQKKQKMKAEDGQKAPSVCVHIFNVGRK